MLDTCCAQAIIFSNLDIENNACSFVLSLVFIVLNLRCRNNLTFMLQFHWLNFLSLEQKFCSTFER